MTRNGVLFSLLPLLIVYLIITRQENGKVIKRMVLAVTIFMGFFCLISIWKFWYLFTEGEYLKTLYNQIIGYGSGGIAAFQNFYDNKEIPNLMGANTFRFVFAVCDKILGTQWARPLEQDFIEIGTGRTTNVYTFYHYYLCDFGMGYALAVQFFIGVFHGVLYKGMTQMRIWGIYMYSIFMYPLVMQFFQDQYFSLTSSWIQLILIGFIFIKSNIIFDRVKEKRQFVIKKN